MLHPKALPEVFRQMEQKQYMKGTGVSDSTVKLTFPHWHDPASFIGRFAMAFGIRAA